MHSHSVGVVHIRGELDLVAAPLATPLRHADPLPADDARSARLSLAARLSLDARLSLTAPLSPASPLSFAAPLPAVDARSRDALPSAPPARLSLSLAV